MRENGDSTWPKGLMAILISASSMPMPVSRIANSTLVGDARRCAASPAARAVNLMALDSRFRRICRSFTASVTMVSMPGSMSCVRVMPRLLALSCIMPQTSRMVSGSATRDFSTVTLPASILLRSRMLPMMSVRCEAATQMWRTYSAYGARRDGAQQPFLHHLGKADDRVERRAQLVAHVGQELALGGAGRIGAGRGVGQAHAAPRDGAWRPVRCARPS